MVSTVRLYQSTDASAPVLTGQAGKLTDLLDAILVNGYGSQPAAGWSINQTTTNKRGYKQDPTGANNSSGMCLYVDDTGPGAGGAREARACGFESMSAIAPTGNGQFPTSGQSTIGVGTFAIRKSATADATARAWRAIADGHTLYLFIDTGDFTSMAFPFVFGDFFSYKSNDQYAVCIIGRTVENTASAGVDWLHTLPASRGSTPTLISTGAGQYIARHWTGVGGSKAFGKIIDVGKFTGAGPGNTPTGGQGYPATTGVENFGGIPTVALGRTTNTTYFPYPNGPDGGLFLSPIWINHDNALRGYLKGLWMPCHNLPLAHGDTYSGTSNMSGKSFLSQMIPATIQQNFADQGQVHVEYSDTWS